MLRWIYFSVVTLTILFSSFILFVWVNRIDLVQTTISRSCDPYKAVIDDMRFSNGTLFIKGLHLISPSGEEKQISSIELHGHLTDYLAYLLLPSHKSLRLEKCHFSSLPALISQSEKKSEFFFTIKQLEVGQTISCSDTTLSLRQLFLQGAKLRKVN